MAVNKNAGYMWHRGDICIYVLDIQCMSNLSVLVFVVVIYSNIVDMVSSLGVAVK
jgi:hypothetical protein